MTPNPPTWSLRSLSTSITATGSHIMAFQSADRPLSTSASTRHTASPSFPTSSYQPSGPMRACDDTGPYDYSNAIAVISREKADDSASWTINCPPEKTIRSECDVDRREIQEFAECVAGCIQDLEAEATRKPTGKAAQLIRRIISHLHKRGINLDFLKKPLDEKTQKEANLGFAAYLLIGCMGLGLMINCVLAQYYYGPRISERIRNTPQDASGIRGALRRLSYRSRVEDSPDRVEQGIELTGPLPTRPGAVYSGGSGPG